MEQQRKKAVSESKIQEWLQMKREQVPLTSFSHFPKKVENDILDIKNM